MRFFIGFLFFVFASFLVWCGLVFGQSGNPTHMSQWIWDAYGKKQNISSKISTKKIVVVSGSNALFGVDSKILRDAFKMPVLNYGVNAGIELPLTLHVAKKVIHGGDIVLMPLEFDMFSYDGTAGVQMIDYIFSREPAFFWELSLYEQFYMLWHMDVQRVYKGYFYQGGKPIVRGLYGVHHIDENGDQIHTSLKYKKKWMEDALKKLALNPEKYGESFDRNALGWKYLKKFVNWCKARDAKVIFMPSTLMRSESYFTSAKEKWFYENLANEVRKKGFVYVGEPYEYMYDKSNYFNTNFHLLSKARKMRTLQMVEDLSKYLNR